MKTVIPDVNFLDGCNSNRYDLSGTFTAHKISAVSQVTNYSWALVMNQQITRSAYNWVSTNTKGTYTTKVITYWNFMVCKRDQDFGFVDIYT